MADDRDMASAPVTTRQAQRGDFDAIADLLNFCFQVERSHIEEDPETRSSVAEAIRRGSIYLVAIHPQGLIGCVLVDLRRRAIFKLAVEPSQRRRGYGSKLMAAAEEYAKGLGWPEVRIATLDFRLELPEYYRRLGYVETGERKDLALVPPARLLRPCQLIMMSKRLAPPTDEA